MLTVSAVLGLVLGAVFSTEEFATGAAGAEDVEAVLRERMREQSRQDRQADLDEAGPALPRVNGVEHEHSQADPETEPESATDTETADVQEQETTGRRLLPVRLALPLGAGAACAAALLILAYVGHASAVLWVFVIPAASVAAVVALSVAGFVSVDIEKRRLAEIDADLSSQHQERSGTDPW